MRESSSQRVLKLQSKRPCIVSGRSLCKDVYIKYQVDYYSKCTLIQILGPAVFEKAASCLSQDHCPYDEDIVLYKGAIILYSRAIVLRRGYHLQGRAVVFMMRALCSRRARHLV
jgi:hypothetical protein